MHLRIRRGKSPNQQRRGPLPACQIWARMFVRRTRNEPALILTPLVDCYLAASGTGDSADHNGLRGDPSLAPITSQDCNSGGSSGSTVRATIRHHPWEECESGTAISEEEMAEFSRNNQRVEEYMASTSHSPYHGASLRKRVVLHLRNSSQFTASPSGLVNHEQFVEDTLASAKKLEMLLNLWNYSTQPLEPKERNDYGNLAIHDLAANGTAELIRVYLMAVNDDSILLSTGNHESEWTPLYAAINTYNYKVVEFLLEHKLSYIGVNTSTKEAVKITKYAAVDRTTPLHYAHAQLAYAEAKKCEVKIRAANNIITAMHRAGAKLDAHDGFGETPAKKRDQVLLSELLSDKMAKLNIDAPDEKAGRRKPADTPIRR